MTTTITYQCERCPDDAPPIRAKVDDTLALLKLCAECQARRFADGLKKQREAESK